MREKPDIEFDIFDGNGANRSFVREVRDEFELDELLAERVADWCAERIQRHVDRANRRIEQVDEEGQDVIKDLREAKSKIQDAVKTIGGWVRD